ncbi:hypothetical protein [Microbacterium elymi]|uniref:Uncharacterized protein n=1 Tax=Microbacterium elymi TaxID=2909587 RepID=A0ABY5NII9_9MICO|nr:hypothetical protein [Microbacterium elymi]UUT34999.1 hypothetical protein L2X98_32125 [Microbacterium elymi]
MRAAIVDQPGAIARAALALGATRVVGVGRDPDRLSLIGELGAVPVPLDGGADALRSTLGQSSPSLVLDYAWVQPLRWSGRLSRARA